MRQTADTITKSKTASVQQNSASYLAAQTVTARGNGHHLPIQLKLSVGTVNDPMEHEADDAADKVMAIPDGPFANKAAKVDQGNDRVSRKSLSTGLTPFIQAKGDPSMKVSGDVSGRIESSKGSGSAITGETKSFMESRFGADFSGVKIHDDNESADLSQSLNAKAFTVSNDIYFNSGQYQPDTDSGKHLLAHELTHVLQQQSGASAQIQRVELSYDDGPDSAGNTRATLDALNAAGAKATFYLVGKKVAQGDNWKVVFDIAKTGHWLGNHAYDWNDVTNDHVFLSGTVEERAQKILQTEWAIRDALITGKADAQKNKAWDAISEPARNYIDDVIAHGTGRFRTPGFRSHLFHRGSKPTTEDSATAAAIETANHVLVAAGLRPLARTMHTKLGEEGVTVDPHDYEKGKTQQNIEKGVKDGISDNSDSVLLHSRIAATAAATPAIVADIVDRHFSFDATPRGALNSITPGKGFAGLSQVSDPPSHSEIMTARKFLTDNRNMGPFLSGGVAIGIFQMCQKAGAAEVDDFIKEIKNTTVDTPNGKIPIANWMQANPEWALFSNFFENWKTNKPFPRIPGVTI